MYRKGKTKGLFYMNKIKSIKFNLANPDEQKLFEYASSKENFSKFIKGLIEKESRRESLPVYRSNKEGVIQIRF